MHGGQLCIQSLVGTCTCTESSKYMYMYVGGSCMYDGQLCMQSVNRYFGTNHTHRYIAHSVLHNYNSQQKAQTLLVRDRA